MKGRNVAVNMRIILPSIVPPGGRGASLNNNPTTKKTMAPKKQITAIRPGKIREKRAKCSNLDFSSFSIS